MKKLEDNHFIKRLEEGTNTRVMLMAHNAYWYQLTKLERKYNNFRVDVFGSSTRYAMSRKYDIPKDCDFIILDISDYYRDEELHEIKEMARKMSEENNKRVSALYAYFIPMDKRTDINMSREIKITSFKNGALDEKIIFIPSWFNLLALADILVKAHDGLENQKIENAINFYMLANNLKYITKDGYQSVADQVYGAMILATAINSEYDRVENLGKTIRIILLAALNELYPDKFKNVLKSMNNCELYTLETSEYYKFENFENKNGRFAFDCTMIELAMTYFFDKLLKEENVQSQNIEELYTIARNYGLTDSFGNDNKKNFEIFRFYYLNRLLKQKIRSGWDFNHWNVSSDRLERVSEHVVGTIALLTALTSEFTFDIDLDRASSVLCIHEIGEINIGDITPFDGITPEQKQEIEHKAIIEVVGNLSKSNDMVNSIFEFDAKKTKESKFIHYCDKLEADIQAKVYQDMGCQHSLSDQQNNVVFKSSKVQKMIEDGASTAFDIWYEWDKSIYINDPIFSKTLKYIKDIKLK